MCLSNFKVMRSFILPISRLRDFTRSYSETSYQILKRCQDSDSIPIRFRLLTGRGFQLKSANSASTPAHGTPREKAMYQISHRNFWWYAQIFRDSRPPWQVSDTEMDVASGSPPGLHGPQKQSQFYKLCNKTITKLLYHRLPTFLRQRTPLFRNIQIHISREIIAELQHLARSPRVGIFRVHTRHARDLIKLGTTSIFCHFWYFVINFLNQNFLKYVTKFR